MFKHMMLASGGTALGLALLLSGDVSRATAWLSEEAGRLELGMM